MDLTKEDREGEECSTDISLGDIPSRAALALAAAATAALVCENDEKQESQEASRLAVWNNSYQGQLAELAKREYTPRGPSPGALWTARACSRTGQAT